MASAVCKMISSSANVFVCQRLQQTTQHQLRHNSVWSSFSGQKRRHFPRMYKCIAILEDGSTITIRHKVPLAYIQYPVDITGLDEKKRRELWMDRKQGITEDDVDDVDVTQVYDIEEYEKYFKQSTSN